MGFLTTEKCCGFLSLKTGGLMLGWIPLMLSIREIVQSIKYNHPQLAGVFAVLALLLVFWIQGITHKKPAWMFPMVIFWNVVLWAEIVCYVVCFYYYVMAPSKFSKFQTSHQEMLIMPLATVIIWHFAAISYSLYKKIDDENRLPTTIHLQQTTGPGTGAPAAQPATPSSPQPTMTAPPSPPPSYDRIYKV